jgi:translocation and assembly module TamB
VDIHVLHLSPFRNSALAQGTISADISLKGKGAAYVVDGSVRPDRMNITIPSKFNSGIPQLNIVDPHADTRAPQALRTVTLAMTIHAPNRIFVRGWGLDAEFGSADDMTIGGTLADPQIHGTLASIQGRYEQFNKRFDLTRANIRFEGSIPPSPFLDIEAQTVADEVTGIIDITGTAKDPKIALSSNPALPQDEVLSHILFGKDMTNISPFQAIQLAGTLQQLTGHGGGGPGLMDTVRGRLGLDDLEVNNDDTGATTVGAGKYITDKVYLQVDAGSAKTSGDANVKYELTPHLSVNSKISEDAQAGGGVTWSWDY